MEDEKAAKCGATAPMDFEAILNEVRQLLNVSDRLDSLAEQNPILTESLIGISCCVRDAATLLEVVVAIKKPALSLISGDLI